MNSLAKNARKILIGILGGLVLLIGLVLIPYPGPGWLIVFFGLAILATEFMWAQGILDRLRQKYDDWQAWIARQPIGIKVLFWLATAAVVVTTIWLFNGYGLLNEWINLGQDWLVSPFVQMDATP